MAAHLKEPTGSYFHQQHFVALPQANCIVETRILPVAEKPEDFDQINSGWRILTGNPQQNLWARVCMAFEADWR